MKTPTKAHEIEILRAAAKDLGPNSYLGPWLESLLPELEADLRSDMLPTLTLAEAKRRAEAQAEAILSQAKAQAEAILKTAQKEADAIKSVASAARHNTICALQNALRQL